MPKAKHKTPRTPKEMYVTMVGFNHRAVAETRREIAEDCPIAVELVREPNNPHDASAIAVHLQEKPRKGMHVGYIPRSLAAMFALKMDLGEITFQEAWLMEADAEGGTGELLLKVVKHKHS